MSAPKLLDQARNRLRRLNYSYSTEKTYLSWIRRFILFHDKRHPRGLGEVEIEAFLVHLAKQTGLSLHPESSPGRPAVPLSREAVSIK